MNKHLLFLVPVFAVFLILPKTDLLAKDDKPQTTSEFSSQQVELVSVAYDGGAINAYARNPTFSGDEKFIAYQSEATNIVENDLNDAMDVFLYDLEKKETSWISIPYDPDAFQGYREGSFSPSVSYDGRYVAFSSTSSLLVAPREGFNHIDSQIFIRDRLEKTTKVVSVSSGGELGNWSSGGPSISGNGQFIVFTSHATNLVPNDDNDEDDIFIYDQFNDTLELVSRGVDGLAGNDWSRGSSISQDGRFVTFTSMATNLVPSDTNDDYDVFVYDRMTKKISRVSITSEGVESSHGQGAAGGSVSGDGTSIVFVSDWTTLVENDNNGKQDVFLHNQQTHQTSLVSVLADGTQNDVASYRGEQISSNGRYVLFNTSVESIFSSLPFYSHYTKYIKNLETGDLHHIVFSIDEDPDDFNTNEAAISSSGKLVAFALYKKSEAKYKIVLYRHPEWTETNRLSMAGQVTDRFGNGIEGAIVWANSLQSTRTNTNGDYVFNNLLKDETYEISVQHEEYTFSPETKVVPLPFSKTNIDFQGQPNKRSWTLMFYFSLDSKGLEQHWQNVEKELLTLSESKHLNVIALVDTYEEKPQILRFNDGRRITLVKFENEMSTGDPQLLETLLQTGLDSFPSEHTGLTIQGHTYGLVGLATDKNPGQDLPCYEDKYCLTFSELGKTLAQFPKLDVIDLDGCYTGAIEIAFEVREQADYLVTSAYLKWVGGNPFGNLDVTADTAPRSLAVLMANNYLSSSKADTWNKPAGTISVLDLAHIQSVKTSVDTMVSQLTTLSVQDRLPLIEKTLDNVQRFGGSSDDWDIDDANDNYIDLGHFAQLIFEYSSNQETRDAASQVITKLNSLIYYEDHWNGKLSSKSKGCNQDVCNLDFDSHNGLSIYFPNEGKKYYSGDNLQFLDQADWPLPLERRGAKASPLNSGWGEFVIEYVKNSSPNREIIYSGPEEPIFISNPLADSVYLPIVVSD